RTDAFSAFMELGWQTTRVLPGRLLMSADPSERIFGTLPPAHGLTEQSGFGSGQYEGRSTCASAGAAISRSAAKTSRVTGSRRASITCERRGYARSGTKSYSNVRLAPDRAPWLGGFHALSLSRSGA